MSNIVNYNEQTFESIKHINKNGQEFWYARELQKTLEYSEWRNFQNASRPVDDIEFGDAHYEVGKKVRQTIAELGGTMPEDLPTPIKSIRQIEKEEAKRIEQS